MADIEVDLVAPGKGLFEGPLWDDREGVLWWVDILNKSIHSHDPLTSTQRTFSVDDTVSAVLLRERGGLILALANGLAVFDPTSSTSELIAEIEADRPDSRLNEAKCDAAGRIWAGTMSSDLQDLRRSPGALYCVDSDHTVHKVLAGIGISNGLGWSPDNSTMYFIDSLAYGVDAFDFELASGAVSNRRRLINFTEADGLPDGLAVDAYGYIWVAVFRSWLLRRYAPDGELAHAFHLPVPQATSCCFGGPDLDELYITTYRAPDTPPESHAGGLFRCRPGTTGRPSARFAG